MVRIDGATTTREVTTDVTGAEDDVTDDEDADADADTDTDDTEDEDETEDADEVTFVDADSGDDDDVEEATEGEAEDDGATTDGVVAAGCGGGRAGFAVRLALSCNDAHSSSERAFSCAAFRSAASRAS